MLYEVITIRTISPRPETVLAIPPPQDTKYVKHVRIQSERLTRFWGRPMHLGAVVLLPHGSYNFV